MSRPFSYNDENFTVIGNILFVHFRYAGIAEVGSRLIEIPPAISDRLLLYTSFCFVAYDIKNTNSHSIVLTVIDYEGKSYLSNKLNLEASSSRYICGFFFLKDI